MGGLLRGVRRRMLSAAAVLGFSPAVAAHGFGRLYNLPVPFWLYGWAAAAVLVLSFFIVALFATAARPLTAQTAREVRGATWVQWLRRALPLLQGLSLALLLLCIVTALTGNRDPYRNFSMTFFWVVFLLGYTYLTAFVGNSFAVLNPWRVLSGALGRYGKGRISYPAGLGDWPALALFLGFIWFELFGTGRPGPLGKLLAAYTLLNLAGVWLVGRAAWFRHCEFFSVFLRLVALHAPLDYQRGESPGTRSSLTRRRPFAALLHHRPLHFSTVVLVLAMLSTTAFDGLRATQWWVQLFWRDPTGLVTALAGTHPMQDIARLRNWYVAWETLSLLASPWLYVAAYLGCLALAKWLTRSTRPLRTLTLDFAYTLLPIALVYHATHYATLLLTQGLKIVSLASDPFGWGWNLFGTALLWRAPILPGMGLVWHTQVGLILIGHLISVVLAHRVALKVFDNRRAALISQLPLLGLMVLLTVAGLWIIAQPLTVERMR